MQVVVPAHWLHRQWHKVHIQVHLFSLQTGQWCDVQFDEVLTC